MTFVDYCKAWNLAYYDLNIQLDYDSIMSEAAFNRLDEWMETMNSKFIFIVDNEFKANLIFNDIVKVLVDSNSIENKAYRLVAEWTNEFLRETQINNIDILFIENLYFSQFTAHEKMLCSNFLSKIINDRDIKTIIFNIPEEKELSYAPKILIELAKIAINIKIRD